MSVAFSTEDAELISRKVEITFDNKRDVAVSLESAYEINKCVDWIKSHQFSKVALQFPDDLLSDAAPVALKIEGLIEKKVFILGDTSYGSCCVDEVAAEHVSADAIIHFGHACLSPTKRLPCLYVFGQQYFDVDDAAKSFKSFFPDKKLLVAVICEVLFFHKAGKFFEKLQEFENVTLSELEIPGETIDDTNESILKKVTINHRRFLIPNDLTISNYKIFYVGNRNVTLTNFMLALPGCPFYSYNPLQKTCRVETLDVNKYLKKRYYYIEKAKDASIVGILVGTLGVSNYLQTIQHIKGIVKSAGKKSYTLVVGKLNSAKLANFSEIDIFVNVACIESSLIECKDYYQPIITPFELEIALNQARGWTGDYILDFSQILPGASSHVPNSKDNIRSDVSLVTGKLRHIGLPCEDKEEESSSSALVTRKAMEISAIHSHGAGEILTQRSWAGLEQKLGETPTAEIEEGQKGIASRYENENSNS